MTVTIDLPDELRRYLGTDPHALARATLEALVLEGFRSGALSTAQARRLLGFRTRNQLDGFLKSRGIDLPLTMEQVRLDTDVALAFSE